MDKTRERTLKTAARYLGMKNGGNAAELPVGWEQLLGQAYEEMLAVAAPRYALLRAPVRVEKEPASAMESGKPLLHFGGLPPVPSSDLCRLLGGCSEGYALLATLGMELDLRIRSLMVKSPALATAIGACGSAYIDEYIDGVLKREGEALTPRFSPGYGDAPLSMQPGLLRFLGAQKLGVYLTDGFLMVPEKSVTALLGVLRKPAPVKADHCEACEKADCAFRGKA